MITVTREGHWIVRAENEAAVYALAEPETELQDGLLLSVEDFHDAAKIAETTKAVGSRAFRKAVITLAGDEMPFSFIRYGYTACANNIVHSSEGYHIGLRNTYLRTQALYDHYQARAYPELVREYGNKGALAVRAVLFDGIVDV